MYRLAEAEDPDEYFNEARLAYRIAVQRSPKLGEAYYKLGLTEEKLQNFRAAYQALLRRHSCEELGGLCQRFSELERDVDAAGEGAFAHPRMQERLREMRFLVRAAGDGQ